MCHGLVLFLRSRFFSGWLLGWSFFSCGRFCFLVSSSLFRRWLFGSFFGCRSFFSRSSFFLGCWFGFCGLVFSRLGGFLFRSSFLFCFHITDRSEEHTSELQSRPHLVCRLL